MGRHRLNVVQRYIFEEECGYARAPPLIPFGLAMCAPVLLEFGSDAQKRRFYRAFIAATMSGARAIQAGLGLGPGFTAHLRRAADPIVTSSTGRRPGRRSRIWPTGSFAWFAPTLRSSANRTASRFC
jgi:hypothetical protein